MPKTTLEKFVQEQKHVEANYMCDLFRRHMKTKKITQNALGDELLCSHTTISNMLKRPVEDWSIGDICKMQKALGCPKDELLEAILMSDGLTV